MKIKGELKSEEDVTISGNVEGSIKVANTLTIGETGSVNADMEANAVRIFGTAKGNITASHKVELLPSGRYFGNIKSKLLVVEEGAILVGDVNKEK